MKQEIYFKIEEGINLRKWQEKDLDHFFQMNNDKEVMEFFPATLSRKQSDDLLKKIQDHFQIYGYGLWALEVHGEFAGFCGLLNLDFPKRIYEFAPGVEIGWRMKKKFWGKGIMTKAAQQVITYAFSTLNLKKIYSFTSKLNKRSEKLMQRIGMDFEAEFFHPKIPISHRLSSHILYSLEKK